MVELYTQKYVICEYNKHMCHTGTTAGGTGHYEYLYISIYSCISVHPMVT